MNATRIVLNPNRIFQVFSIILHLGFFFVFCDAIDFYNKNNLQSFQKLKLTEAVCSLHFHTKSVRMFPLPLLAELGEKVTVMLFGHDMIYENPKFPAK